MIFDLVLDNKLITIIKPIDKPYAAWDLVDMLRAANFEYTYIVCWDGYENAVELQKKPQYC